MQEPISKPEKKPIKHVERVVIEEKLTDKLTSMRDQANQALQGIASVTKSDIVNLVFAGHPDSLSASEIETLKVEHLDQVKYAFWIARRLKEAQAAGEALTMQDLLAAHAASIGPAKVVRTPRRRREKKALADEASTVNSAEPMSQ